MTDHRIKKQQGTGAAAGASEPAAGPDGARERKRLDKRRSVVRTGLALFAENGFEETTMDMIAASAGISRRALFYMFKSKDEILLAAQDTGFFDALPNVLAGQSPRQTPFEAVRGALPALVAHFETEESVVVDRLMRSTEALRARKQAVFLEMEQVLYEALRGIWEEPGRAAALRTVAMASIGALRLAMDAWRGGGGDRSLGDYLRDAFAELERQI